MCPKSQIDGQIHKIRALDGRLGYTANLKVLSPQCTATRPRQCRTQYETDQGACCLNFQGGLADWNAVGWFCKVDRSAAQVKRKCPPCGNTHIIQSVKRQHLIQLPSLHVNQWCCTNSTRKFSAPYCYIVITQINCYVTANKHSQVCFRWPRAVLWYGELFSILILKLTWHCFIKNALQNSPLDLLQLCFS